MKALIELGVLGLILTVAACGESGPPEEPPSSSSPDQAADPSRSGALETVATLELETTYPEGFSFLNGVRELSDGTLLAADPLAEVLLHIDLDTGATDTLGRPGPGPQEYKQPDQVFPLPGDSSLLVDLGKMQLTEIEPDGSFGAGIPMAMQTEGRFPMILHPRFVDALGRLYDRAPRAREGRAQDSVAIIRFHPATQALDTVAMLWSPRVEQVRSRGGGLVPRMLEARNGWAVGDDGRVAIIQAEDFSVEWLLPDGWVVHGPSNPVPLHQTGTAEKEAVVAGMGSSGISMTSVSSPSGGVQEMTMRRGISRPGDGPTIDDFQWAETLPLFRSDRAVVSPLGELWIERHLPEDSLPEIADFDEAGQLRGVEKLPPGRQLLGFGRGTDGLEVVYLARTDEFDLRWLERYGVVR